MPDVDPVLPGCQGWVGRPLRSAPVPGGAGSRARNRRGPAELPPTRTPVPGLPGQTAVCDTPWYDGCAGLDVPAAAPARLRVRRGGRDRGLPGRPGRDARLPVAGPAGRARLPARVRRGGPFPGVGRPGRGGGAAGHGGPVPPARAGRDRQRGAQPHGHPRARVAQPAALVGAPGGARLALRALVRRGLGGAGRAAAAADPGRAGGRLPRRHHRRRGGRGAAGGGGAGAWRGAGGRGAASGPRRGRAGAALLRPRAAGPSRHRRAAAGGTARRPALPARRLARRRGPAELAAVFRRHLAHRGPGGGSPRVRCHPPGTAPPGRGGARRRPAGGPSRRAGRSPRLPGAAGRRSRWRLGGHREDPQRRRETAGRLGLRGHHWVRHPGRGRRPVRGPGRRRASG